MSKPSEWMNTSLNLYKAWLDNLTSLTSPPPPPTSPFTQWTQGLQDSFQNLGKNPMLTMIPWTSYTGVPPELAKTFTEYQEALMEYNSKLWQTWQESWGKFTSQYPETVKKGAEDPEAMYREWLNTFKANYDKFFRTEEFSKVLAKLLDKSLDMRKATDNLLQELLKRSNIPTRQEVDELQHEIHELKKVLSVRADREKPATRRRRK